MVINLKKSTDVLLIDRNLFKYFLAFWIFGLSKTGTLNVISFMEIYLSLLIYRQIIIRYRNIAKIYFLSKLLGKLLYSILYTLIRYSENC